MSLNNIPAEMVDPGSILNYLAQDVPGTSGLTFGYKAGKLASDTALVLVPKGFVTLTANATNYIYADPGQSPYIFVNQTSYPQGKIKLFTVSTENFGITGTVSDDRTPFKTGAISTVIPVRVINPASGILSAVATDQLIGIYTIAAVTLQLPLGAVLGKTIEVKDAGGLSSVYNITVLPPSGQTIEGQANFVIASNKACFRFVFNGVSDWYVASAYSGSSSLAPTSVPTGTVIPYTANAAVPSGFLTCDGSAVLRSTYAGLFTLIGITFGAGNGTTTFNLPDLRGQFIRGYDAGAGIDPGRVMGTTQTDTMASHTHASTFGLIVQIQSVTAGYPLEAFSKLSDSVYNSSLTSNATGGTETRPKNLALVHLIKY